MNFKICIPTYHREDKLRELLSTIPENINVLISDNGSTVGKDICDLYENITVKKVLPEVTMFQNWNQAGFMADSEWLVIPSDDDMIEKGMKTYGKNADMLVFGHHIVDGEGEIISTWTPTKLETCAAPKGFKYFQYGVEARMPSIIIRTSLFKELGGFCEDFKLTASDSDLIQRLSLVGNVQFIPEVVSGYRVWDGGATSLTIASKNWMDEIDYWCNRIDKFCQQQGIKDVYSNHIQDEIYARNLSGGLSSLKKNKGYSETWKHFRQCRFPSHATLKTKMHLIYALCRP